MGLVLVGLLQVAPQEDRAEKLCRRITFPSDAEREKRTSKDEVGRRILATLLKRDHWIGALRAVESKLTPFPDDLQTAVELTEWEGTSPAHGTGAGSQGTVKFNMRRLLEYQTQVDEFEKKRKELERQGKRMYWKVPPIRFDRLIYHELTHVLQRAYEAPDWFLEGMASWIGDDSNYLYAFAVAGKSVEDLDAPLAESDDAYGRGMIFFQWLDSKIKKEGIAKLAAKCLTDRRPWKEALEEATGLPWEKLKKEEQSWSAQRMKRYVPKDK